MAVFCPTRKKTSIQEQRWHPKAQMMPGTRFESINFLEKPPGVLAYGGEISVGFIATHGPPTNEGMFPWNGTILKRTVRIGVISWF